MLQKFKKKFSLKFIMKNTHYNPEDIKNAILEALDDAWFEGKIGLNILELSKRIGISRITLPKYLNELLYQGKIKKRKINSKLALYVLSKRYRY